jgi:hypothetical protein
MAGRNATPVVSFQSDDADMNPVLSEEGSKLVSRLVASCLLCVALIGFGNAAAYDSEGGGSGGFSFTHGARARSDVFYNHVNDTSVIELIVLWRGQPWWDRQMPAAGSAAAPPPPSKNDRLAEINGTTQFSTRGNVSYSLIHDRDTRTVIINATDTLRYEAGSTLIVMVDRIDAVGGPHVVTSVSLRSPTRAAVLGAVIPRDSLPAVFADAARRRSVNENVTRYLNTMPAIAGFIK